MPSVKDKHNKHQAQWLKTDTPCGREDPEHPGIFCVKDYKHEFRWHEGPSFNGDSWHTWITPRETAQLPPAQPSVSVKPDISQPNNLGSPIVTVNSVYAHDALGVNGSSRPLTEPVYNSAGIGKLDALGDHPYTRNA